MNCFPQKGHSERDGVRAALIVVSVCYMACVQEYRGLRNMLQRKFKKQIRHPIHHSEKRPKVVGQ